MAVTVARVLTILFGAVPASVLSVWALLGVIAGTFALLGGMWIGALLIVWGLAGIYGAVALWAVGFGCDEPNCVRGLAVGVAAILPLAIWADSLHLFLTDEFVYSTVLCRAPLVVGVGWLLALPTRQKLFDFGAAEV